MTLTLKQRAALNVAKKFTFAMTLALLVVLGFYLIPVDIAYQALCLAFLAFCVYNLYKIEVSSLESKEALSKFDEK